MAVNPPFVRGEEINGPAFGDKTHAPLGAGTGLQAAVGHERVDADESAASAGEGVRGSSKRPVEPGRQLAGPGVVDKGVLHDAAVFGAGIDRPLSRDEPVLCSSPDRVPCGQAIEFAVDDMP